MGGRIGVMGSVFVADHFFGAGLLAVVVIFLALWMLCELLDLD